MDIIEKIFAAVALILAIPFFWPVLLLFHYIGESLFIPPNSETP